MLYDSFGLNQIRVHRKFKTVSAYILLLSLSYMGVVSSHKELVVATVNYSGILYSPFEFYSQESYLEEEKMSKCFRKLLEESYQNFDPKTFKWGLGKVDQKLQKERYAVIYRQQAGVENNKLLNEEEFRNRWRQEFEKAKATGKVEATPQQIKNTENFDVHCYRTFIYYLYDEKNLAKAPQLNPEKYKEFKKTFFSKSFLNQKQKIKQTFNAMQQEEVDVFFFQQSSKQFEQLLKQKKEFVSFKSEKSTSLIVLRKRKFVKIHDTNKILSHISQQFVKGLNYNDDSSICFADNFIFLNLHLSSKKEKNPLQVKKFSEDLEKLREIYPMCEIIAGGDLNSFLSPQLVSKQFHVFPDKEDTVTTMKKRTWIQPQVNKADELSRECKDSLVSTLPFTKQRIVTILGLDYKKIKYIPNQEHPCDHFVVTANIIVRA